MAWVKIDDQVPRHVKFIEAGPSACWMWVCGIAHCQSQLTDGFVSNSVLSMIGVRGRVRTRRLAETLVQATLFERVEGGYMVHDYLHHNPSKASVLAKRAEDAERKHVGEALRTPRKIHAESKPTPELPAPASHPIPSHPNSSSRRNGGNGAAMPILKFPRFAVFRWMVDELIAILGPQSQTFSLDEWFETLSAHAEEQQLVIDDAWKYIKAQTLVEAQRRGLRLAGSVVARPANAAGTEGRTCPHDPRCETFRECTDRVIAEGRAARA